MMKKLRKGDRVAMKSNRGYIYNVTRHDGGQWRGTIDPEHKHYNPGDEGVEAHLGSGKGWIILSRGPSKKDEQIEKLTAELGERKAALDDLRAFNEAEKLKRELALLEAGYVSIETLRRNTLRDVVRSYDGVSPFTLVRLELKHPIRGEKGEKYMSAFLKALTRQ